jgi:hypothetical protein
LSVFDTFILLILGPGPAKPQAPVSLGFNEEENTAESAEETEANEESFKRAFPRILSGFSC